jgi:hypothetical protein
MRHSATVKAVSRMVASLWSVALWSAALPSVGLPSVGLPSVGLPSVGLPSVRLSEPQPGPDACWSRRPVARNEHLPESSSHLVARRAIRRPYFG